MPHSDEFLSLLTATAPVSTVSLGASPSVYVAPAGGVLVVQGGTVSLLELGRNGAYLLTGVIAGFIPLRKGDSVRITHVVAPTVNWVPEN